MLLSLTALVHPSYLSPTFVPSYSSILFPHLPPYDHVVDYRATPWPLQLRRSSSGHRSFAWSNSSGRFGCSWPRYHGGFARPRVPMHRWPKARGTVASATAGPHRPQIDYRNRIPKSLGAIDFLVRSLRQASIQYQCITIGKSMQRFIN
jgi:hypothetical protein